MKYASSPRMVLIRVICLLVLPLSMVPIHAQSTLGSIFGTVTDSSGAIIPSASITVTNVEQGTTRTTKTTANGSYRVTELDPGTYRVSAEHRGFDKAVSERIPIGIEASVRADLSLKAGSESVTVEVNAANVLLETGSAEVSSQVTTEELHDLPSIDRNIVSFMSLGPGTTGGNYSSYNNSGGRVGTITGAEVVAMGTPPVGNSFLLDGVTTNMEFSGTIAARPPMDMAAGFQSQIAQFPANEGRAAGAIFNMSLKSGTNAFHGSVYGYVQNSFVNASPKIYTTVTAVLPYHRYEYGGNVGGPIIRNKLFFFAGWEGLKQLQTTQTNYTVPAMSEKHLYSDFASLGIVPKNPPSSGCSGYYFGAATDSNGYVFGGIAEYDPTGVTYGTSATRKEFPSNCIPANRVSPIGQALLQFYPDPNSGAKTYAQTTPHNLLGDWEVGKANWTLTRRDFVDMHYLRQNQGLVGSALDPAISTTTLAQDGINAGINYIRIISPAMVNTLRLSYTRFYLWDTANNQTNYMGSMAIPGWANDIGSTGAPEVIPQAITTIAPYSSISAFAINFRLKENNYQLQDMLSWQHGKHSFKIGGEYEQIRFWEFRTRLGGGNLSFNGTSTSTSSSATSSDGIGDMLLGLTSGITAHYEFAPGAALRTHYIMPFVQDDWRVLNNLTINLGLRYNIFTPYHAEHDMTWNFDPNTGTVLIPQTSTYAVNNFGFTNGLPAHWAYVPRSQVYKSIYWKSFDPRIGYALQINPKLVWRGGFGLYHIPVMGNTPLNGTTDGLDIIPSISTGAPICLDETQGAWCKTVGLPTGGIQATLTSQGFVPFFLPRNLPDPYSTKYTMDIQFSPSHTTSVAVGYLGANTQHFASLYNANQAPVVSTTVSLVTRQPYPNFGTSLYSYAQVDHTNYNGGIVSFQFRNWHGLQFKSYYTYSKTLGLGTGNDEVLVTPYIANYDYGRLDYDIRHRWTTTFIERLPKLNHPRVIGAILGQWDLSGIINLQSGMPMTITDSGGTAINVGTTGGSGQRPYLLHNPNLPKNRRTAAKWFDTTAFAHTYWCTGAQINADILTTTALAINSSANPCENIVAIPAPSAQTNTPLATHVVSSTASTMPVPWGNGGKNIIDGPGQELFSTAIQRRFLLKKGYITLRLEEYNLFNHPNYSNPSGLNFNGGSFGVVQSSTTAPRQLHGALRYDF